MSQAPAPTGRLATILARHWLLLAAIALAVGARVAFWVGVGRVWEDALITLAAVENVFRGIGLTQHGGEGHVYSYTSALSVLVPLLSEAIHRGTGLAAMRVASVLASVAACTYAYLIARRLRFNPWATAFVLAYLAVDWNQVLYGMAGMETEIAVALALASAYHLLAGHGARLGFALGLALLARPDLLLLIIPALVAVVLSSRWRALATAAMTAAVVAPWLVFTLVYYGTIVPGTISVKATRYVSIPPFRGFDFTPQVAWVTANVPVNLLGALQRFVPFYADSAVVGAPLPFRVLALTAVGVVALAVVGVVAYRREAGWLALAACCGLWLIYRVLFLPPFYYDWYVPPFAALVVLLAAGGLTAMAPRAPAVAVALAVILVAGYAAPLVPLSVISERVQRDIEGQVRIPLARYLAANVPKGQPVISESAGYVGYYSGVKLYDYPGLTSPTSARADARAPGQSSIAYLVDALRAPWLVLRPFEVVEVRRYYPGTLALYHPIAEFDANVDLGWGGAEMSNIDERFVVLKRVR